MYFLKLILKSLSALLLLLILIYPNHTAAAQMPADTIVKVDHQPTTDSRKFNSITEQINERFTPFVNGLASVLFWDPFAAAGIYDQQVYDTQGKPVTDTEGKPVKAPLKLIVLWLMAGGLFFTVYLRFINIRAFRHSIGLIMGKHDKPGSSGEVSHFQALTTALSATVGLGNIAGVAIAISIGGPGATLWMIMAGLLGMSLKFSECTLGLKYRTIDKDGRVSGGAMYYLREGLARKGLGKLGWFLAVLFSIMVIGGSVGGGNMLQANQAFEQFASFFPQVDDFGFWYGIVMAVLVGLVIVGGIRSIARVTSRIVPVMALIYVTASMIIILMNIQQAPHVLSLIWNGAFEAEAMRGGFIGVLIFGFQRGAFSNEAGVGSASIAHAAARTSEPVSEGIVSLLEPFVDTVIICTMTAMVIIFSGVYEQGQGIQGVQLTSAAYASVFSWFPYVLLVAVTLFAFSTMISWSYYGMKGFDFLFGGLSQKLFGSRNYSNQLFNLLFLLCIVIGTSSNLGPVMDFSDMMVLCMAFPNLLGLFILTPEVRRDMKKYWQQHRAIKSADKA
jgi:AGCS family alanine or glycine:cation symporter